MKKEFFVASTAGGFWSSDVPMSRGLLDMKREINITEEKDRVQVWIDGASQGNPGHAGIGAVALDPDGREIFRVSEYLGISTNNVAEYQALIFALKELARRGVGKAVIRSDSELLIKQLSGAFKVKNENLRGLISEVRGLLSYFEDVRFEQVPREKNRIADRLAFTGIEKGLSGEKEPVARGQSDTLF